MLPHSSDHGTSSPRALVPLYHASLSHVLGQRLRKMLRSCGYDLRTGLPKAGDLMLIWGGARTAQRSLDICVQTEAIPLYAEDAWIRSIHPSDPTSFGLTLDRKRPHFDPTGPSDLEDILATHPFEDSLLMTRAQEVMDWLKYAQISKYNAMHQDIAPPAPGYVLVIDQTHGDASVTASGGDASHFVEMLVTAHENHPQAPILIKSHPAALDPASGKQGYFAQSHASAKVSFETRPLSTWMLMEGAVAVYTYSSQMGLEAILAGHKPHVFGQPFYAGWGLTHDYAPIDRRTRKLTRAQLVAGAYLLYPQWIDPHSHHPCTIEDILAQAEAEARAWREDHLGWTAANMRLWKRKPIYDFFGTHGRVRFADHPKPPKRHMSWGRSDAPETYSVEDGFIRSRGLGAALVPPLSLVLDPKGIYFDATRPSHLDDLIIAAAKAPRSAKARVERVIEAISAHDISKYNVRAAPLPDLPQGYHLVLGQVEGDASLQFGATEITTNDALLRAVWEAQPDAPLVYKPHPDVVAGLRPGALTRPDLADVVLDEGTLADALKGATAVHTMTSLGGFEALLRGLPVHTYGMPFYAGWGLTQDRQSAPAWRRRHVELWQLIYAVLMVYPRYFDPIYGRPTSPERVIALLANGLEANQSKMLRLLAKLQGWAVSLPFDWRALRRK